MRALHDMRRAWRRFRARPPAERARLLRLLGQKLRTTGALGALRWIRGSSAPADEAMRYLHWCAQHTPREADLARMRDASFRFAYRPLVSILTPVYNTEPKWLEACADSVMGQVYPEWEWCVADDGSTRAATVAALASIAARDARIRVLHLPANGGIAAATNVALHAARGDYIALLDHDDALLPHAVFRMVEALNRDPRPLVLYSDEDKLDLDGVRCDAYFKPDWSPDLFLSSMYVCHLLVAQRSLVQTVGGFRSEYDFSQDYDLVLRLMERVTDIAHVPDVLYHWRKIPESAALAGAAKPTAHLAAQAALTDYLQRNAIGGRIEDAGPIGLHRVRYAIEGTPLVSIVLPAASTLGTIRERTRYQHVEVVVAPDGRPHAARGEHLLFVADGVEPLDPSWLEYMLELSQRRDIGAVGAKLYHADGTLHHVGMVLGLGGLVGFPFQHHHADTVGYFSNAQCIRNCSAVTGACLMTRREVFDKVGGFDEALQAYGDVDYCLKVRAAGFRVVFTPYARLTYHRADAVAARSVAETAERLRSRWGSALDRDPYYNPNLTREFLDYRVAI